MKTIPTIATGIPNVVIENNEKPASPVKLYYCPFTTKLVLVPMSVKVPPRIAV
jgi:hypothetical protein